MMTTPAFNLPARLNKDSANDGVWVEFYSELTDHTYGKFKLRSMDPTTKHMQVVRNKKMKSRPAPQGRSLNETERKLFDEFIEICIVDWEIADVNGKPIPFDIPTAKAYFFNEDCREVLDFCWDFSSDLSNFRAGLKKDEIVKN